MNASLLFIQGFSRRVACAVFAGAALCVNMTCWAEPAAISSPQTPLETESAKTIVPENVSHGIAYVRHGEKEGFAGWPANEGMWAWGDEILVAFQIGDYSPADNRHNIALNGTKRIGFARSLDGGQTWQTEFHDNVAGPDAQGDPKRFSANTTVGKSAIDCPGVADFTHPDFCMKLRGDVFYTSENRGRDWQGPYRFAGLDPARLRLETRTAYLITGTQSAFVFLTARAIPGGWRSGVAQTRDGGRTFEWVSWIDDTRDPSARKPTRKGEPVYSIMPAICTTADGHWVVGLREKRGKRCWTDVLSSADNGKTWSPRATVEVGGNSPAALVTLADGKTVACVYNYRKAPFGIRVKLSADNGKTWSPPYALREDGLSWDIGYPRALRLPDGRILVAYYFSRADEPQQHIAVTVWTPSPEQVRAAADAARAAACPPAEAARTPAPPSQNL